MTVTTLPVSCTQGKNVRGSEPQKAVVHVKFWKFCTTAMHEHTVITLTFKNCAQFIKCVRKINNKQLDNAKDIDVVMPTYN